MGIQPGEILILLAVVLLVVGPERLPEYARKLGQFVREVRGFADSAKSQLKEEMGDAFDDVDWKQLDPRQYDPRRIVREALMESAPSASAESHDSSATVAEPGAVDVYDPSLPTPFDPEAT